MKVVGIIPARYESSRFPGKPLAHIAGKPMIERVFTQAAKATQLSDLIVATDDKRIFDCVEGFGGKAMMTSPECNNGTERCAEVIRNLSDEIDAVINIQGDEPILQAAQIDQLIELLKSDAEIATLAHGLQPSEFEEENVVKVAIDNQNIATSFSRDYQFIQHQSSKIFKHIGLYAFQKAILLKVVNLQVSPNEALERLEQLRWLDHGYAIKVGITPFQNFSVDVPSDIEKILQELKQT